MGNDTSPLVSIGIPTYNRANGYLKEAIQCALDQTYSPIEIVISDNCSSDHTPALVQSFEDKRIRYHRHEKNIGANNNFNYCLEKASGKYFLLFHDDDLIDPDHIASCISAVDGAGEVGVIRTGIRIIDNEGNVIMERHNEADNRDFVKFIHSWFQNRTATYLCNTLYNTQRLKEIGGFHSKMNLYQDMVATVKLQAGFGSADVKEPKASFRKHETTAGTSATIRKWCIDSLFLLETISNLAGPSKMELHRAGMEYFCRQNYERASRNLPLARRFLAYGTVARYFRFHSSPFAYAYKSDIQPILSRIKRNIGLD